ncbi:MAG: hypothetical protein KAG61_11310 [Bacteriovoracaceae bacterium]|nr:hypothetical protein [Bacteriovoracaceae bacterium]
MKRVTVKLSHWIILNNGQTRTLQDTFTFEVEDLSDEQFIHQKSLKLFEEDFEIAKKEGRYPHSEVAQIAVKDFRVS